MDTNALIWFLNGDYLDTAALVAIVNAQNSNGVFVSPMSAWEAALAVQKLNGRPNLGGRDAAEWFRSVLKIPGARLIRQGIRIAIEAAKVPAIFDHGDPGDCFLIATAHLKRLPLITRDKRIRDFAEERPEYLRVIRC
jgi:PIN domain nuclease of toxin-antitoxin system